MCSSQSWVFALVFGILLGAPISAQVTERVSVATGGAEGNSGSYTPSISADGSVVAFWSEATNLVASDTNGFRDLFVRDLQSGTTELVSLATSGAQGNSSSDDPSISADGRFVAFSSVASNLVATDTNANKDVFVHDRQNATTERVSVATGGAEGNSESRDSSISADGRFVAYFSHAGNLAVGDTNGLPDVFVHDRQSGTTERVSVATGGTQGDNGSYQPSISADGRFVAFYSDASNLVAGDTNTLTDVFVHDRQNGSTERVSLATGGAQGNDNSWYPSISPDGRFVAFMSYAANLVAADTNGALDVFIHDRQGGTTERVSVATIGGVQGNADSRYPSVSADGRFVAFWSLASNLDAGDTNSVPDIFVRDGQSGTTERVSVATGGAQADSYSWYPSISGDGVFVAFESFASNLVAGDTNGSDDVFVHDRGGPHPPSPFCLGDGSAGACPCGNNGSAGRGCQNSASTGGSILTATGINSLSSDTLILTASGELPSVLSIFVQGDAATAGVNFGDGLRCVRGILESLYVRNASGGVVSAPLTGDPSISTRSAALGDPIPSGATRHYQTHYRDPNLAFCPDPPGNSWNVSNGLSVVWGP